jgi:Ribbon-helix-helix protein, copG family
MNTYMGAFTAMVRTQIQLKERQLEVLRARAAQLNVSISEVVRRAIDTAVGSGAAVPRTERRRRAVAAAGRFSSGRSDVAERHDDYLAEAFKS